MPSHSAKQHRFMEAIAHSPSFAKKAGVPQSVGKDYAAADKGKTFKRGGDMKESKAMVGKEVAFMKKKGAPKSMIKHEMSEMKGMKAGGNTSRMNRLEELGRVNAEKASTPKGKRNLAEEKNRIVGELNKYAKGGRVRRMAEGGLNDMGEGAALSNRSYGYEEEKERGAKNLEGIKNFFGFGKKKDEEAAPIDRSRDKPPPVIRPSMGGPSTSTQTSRVSSQSPRTRRETEDTSASDAVEREDAASMDRTTKGPQYTSSINTEGGEYSGDGFFKPAKESRVSPAKEPTRTRRPATVSRTRETTSVTAEPAKGKVPAKIDSEKLLRDAEEEVLRKKPTAMTEQMRKAPTINDLYKGQKSMGEEIGDVLKGFRESIRGGLQKGKERQESKGSTMYAKGGNVKRMRYGGEPDSSMDMGQPMRGSAPPAAPRGGGLAGIFGNRSPGAMAAAQKMLASQRTSSPIEPPRSPIEPPPKEPKGLPGQTPEELIQEKNRRIFNSGMTQSSQPGGSTQIGGPGIKAGGQVKKMAEGGYAKADGVAKKGKTQPKMVKMASGGFVKTADGCAQRGKTKAFQVKMKRGGMC